MLELVIACIYLTLLVSGAIGLLWRYLHRSIPELVQNVLNDVGKQLEKTFENPTIRKAYGILGQKSGDARAEKALRVKVADKVMDENPIIKKALEYFDIEPLEGLQLLNDPMIGPLIQGYISKLQGGIHGNPGQGGGGLP